MIGEVLGRQFAIHLRPKVLNRVEVGTVGGPDEQIDVLGPALAKFAPS